MNKYHHFQELADHQRPFLHIGICSPNQQACYSVADVSDHVLSPHWLPKCLYLLSKNQCGFFLQNSQFAPSVKQDCDIMHLPIVAWCRGKRKSESRGCRRINWLSQAHNNPKPPQSIQISSCWKNAKQQSEAHLYLHRRSNKSFSTYLNSYRFVRCTRSSFNNAFHPHWLCKKTRPSTLVNNNINWTAHVNINEVHCALLINKFNCACYSVWVCPTYLYTKQIFWWMSSQQSPFWSLSLFPKQYDSQEMRHGKS